VLNYQYTYVDHDLLLQRLQFSFGLVGVMLEWIQSFLTNGTQQIAYVGQLSTIAWHDMCRRQYHAPGLLISNIDIDVDIIDDTFDVSISISTILSYKSIDRGIDDTLLAFLSTLHRYFSTDMRNDAHNVLSFRAFVRVQRSVEILDERRITCNKI